MPYTEMVMTCDALEESLDLGFELEDIVNDMFDKGYNMDVFYPDYDFETNLRKRIPFLTKTSKDGKTWIQVLDDGIVGGFTFSDGHKSIIYQCGICGKLSEYDKGHNKHRKEAHNQEPIHYGSAEPVQIEELWQITEEDLQ